ncbi:MAG TPA: hypothetical protein VF800_27715 [Telluria sp.]
MHITGALLLCASLTPAAHAQRCPEKDAYAASALIERLDSWEKIANSRTQYAHCDGGNLAQDKSEVVLRRLVDHWETLPELAKLIKRDPSLQPWVMSRIAKTYEPADFKQLTDQALTACPPGLAALCADLEKSVGSAYKKRVSPPSPGSR